MICLLRPVFREWDKQLVFHKGKSIRIFVVHYTLYPDFSMQLMHYKSNLWFLQFKGTDSEEVVLIGY